MEVKQGGHILMQYVMQKKKTLKTLKGIFKGDIFKKGNFDHTQFSSLLILI